ncbi:MAG: hypothetical protein HYY13_11510 [Nitrospirae bacterium]|nr:hypothetical protein [Nitrospirota bacterium]
MKLPNSEQAIIDRAKIVDYLLCSTHDDGWGKAQFFAGFGFRLETWEELAAALRTHGMTHDVKDVVESEHGTIYVVVGSLDAPNGRSPDVRSVWMVDKGGDTPRLITAYPLD